MPTRTMIIPLFSPIQFQSFGAEVVPLVVLEEGNTTKFHWRLPDTIRTGITF